MIEVSAPVDILVLAAHPPELVGLVGALGERFDGEIRGMRVVATTVGIGLPVAGAGTANRIQRLSPRCAVLLGSCGVYPGVGHYRPNDVLVPNRILLLDHVVLAGRGAFPEPMTVVTDPHPLLTTALGQSGPRCRIAPLATTLSITTDDVLAASVHQSTGCEGENLEAFGVALACAAAGVPFAAVLGVTNIVGSTAREDWRTYQRSAAIAAADVFVAWAARGAPGLPHG